MILTGWLDRMGIHYPADFMDHYKVAIEKFDKNDWELEEMGIVKIFNGKDYYRCIPGTDIIYYIQSPFRLSNAQMNWLNEHNFKIDEGDMPL